MMPGIRLTGRAQPTQQRGAEGMRQPSTSTPAPRIISAPFSGLSLWLEQPCVLLGCLCPLSSFCVIYFLRRVGIIFS